METRLQSVQQREGRAVRHISVCRAMALDVYIQHDGRSMFGHVYITAFRGTQETFQFHR